jgi:bilirubin oxidase
MLTAGSGYSQNPLFIPPVLSGTNFNLDVQDGVVQFYQGFNTPTYGVNGNILGPTMIWNKGDAVTLNVTNSLAANHDNDALARITRAGDV